MGFARAAGFLWISLHIHREGGLMERNARRALAGMIAFHEHLCRSKR